MSEIVQRYDEMWSNAVAGFEAGTFEFDALIDDVTDTRRGLTLIGRLHGDVVSEINGFLDAVKVVEPNHYFYPPSGLHITALAVIAAHNGFSMEGLKIEGYIPVIAEVLAGMEPLRITFKGITASPSCIMIQGFPEENQLNRLRDRLRDGFGGASVHSSIDARYRIITAHSTILRLRVPVTKGPELVTLLKQYRDHDFGLLELDQFELVFNDWYHREVNTKLLRTFRLNA